MYLPRFFSTSCHPTFPRFVSWFFMILPQNLPFAAFVLQLGRADRSFSRLDQQLVETPTSLSDFSPCRSIAFFPIETIALTENPSSKCVFVCMRLFVSVYQWVGGCMLLGACTKVLLESCQFSTWDRKLHYKVASSQLPAPQIAPRTKVVLQSRQFSSSSSADTPRTKVVLQSRQFSSSSSADTPCTKVVLQSRQFSASSSADTPRTKVVLQSRQISASSSTDTPRTKVVLQSRQFSASSSSDCSAY